MCCEHVCVVGSMCCEHVCVVGMRGVFVGCVCTCDVLDMRCEYVCVHVCDVCVCMHTNDPIIV